MNPNFLAFEQPIAELEAKIEDLRFVGDDSEINITDEIERLGKRSRELTASIFGALTPWQIAKLARHPQRPYTLDYLAHIVTDLEELHGDRALILKPHRVGTKLFSHSFDFLDFRGGFLADVDVRFTYGRFQCLQN